MWKNIWSTNVPAKVLVHAWNIVNNRLPTRANVILALSGLKNKDGYHVVVVCPHARAVRHSMHDENGVGMSILINSFLRVFFYYFDVGLYDESSVQ